MLRPIGHRYVAGKAKRYDVVHVVGYVVVVSLGGQIALHGSVDHTRDQTVGAVLTSLSEAIEEPFGRHVVAFVDRSFRLAVLLLVTLDLLPQVLHNSLLIVLLLVVEEEDLIQLPGSRRRGGDPLAARPWAIPIVHRDRLTYTQALKGVTDSAVGMNDVLANDVDR